MNDAGKNSRVNYKHVKMGKKEFRIVASNGEKYCEFYYITQMPAGDFIYGGIGNHEIRWTYHVSGKQHMHRAGKRHDNTQPSLKEIKGLIQIQDMGMGKLVFSRPGFGKEPRTKKVHGRIFFDIRKFIDAISVSIFLMEPYAFAKLKNATKGMHEPQIHIITESTPWIVVIVYDWIFEEYDPSAFLS
ncbi:MAG: hypothetical protein ACKVOK_10005 [Flavobacteriales bacterium]